MPTNCKRVGGLSREDQRHLRNLAVQIAAQLPADYISANYVISEVQHLADDFLFCDEARRARGKLVSIKT